MPRDEDNDASLVLINSGIPALSKAEHIYFCPSYQECLHSKTEKKRQDHLLTFCLDYDFPPSSLTQFGLCTKPSPSYHFYQPLCELGTYSYQFLGFRPSGAGIKVLRRSVRFPLHSSLVSPERILLLYKCFPPLCAGSKRANLRML